jgi:hypothetical protein
MACMMSLRAWSAEVGECQAPGTRTNLGLDIVETVVMMWNEV